MSDRDPLGAWYGDRGLYVTSILTHPGFMPRVFFKRYSIFHMTFRVRRNLGIPMGKPKFRIIAENSGRWSSGAD